MKKLFLLFAILTVSAFGASSQSNQESNQDPTLVITQPLSKFSNIIIKDVTTTSSVLMLGYPGIWIEETDTPEAKITYNNVCTPYISTELTDNTLVVKIDQAFLYPQVSEWRRSYGMISAIKIEVPRKYGLKSIYNTGGYQFNTTLINFDCKSLAITSSNSFNLMNCKIKKLTWNEIEGKPLANRCQYTLGLEYTNIGTLSISESGVSTFKIGNNIGSTIKDMKFHK